MNFFTQEFLKMHLLVLSQDWDGANLEKFKNLNQISEEAETIFLILNFLKTYSTMRKDSDLGQTTQKTIKKAIKRIRPPPVVNMKLTQNEKLAQALLT
jgi:hypothetical protein